MRSLTLILVLGVLALAGVLAWTWLSMRTPETAWVGEPGVPAEAPETEATAPVSQPDVRRAIAHEVEEALPAEPSARPDSTSVRGVVLRPDGRPAEGAWVWTGTLALATVAGRDRWAPGRSRVQSAADGRFELGRLAAGSVQLMATAEDAAPSEPLRVEIADGQVLEGVVLRLRAGARIRGEVWRPDGAPAAGRLLRLSQAEHGQLEEVSADEEGRFLAERLVPGSWRIDTFPDEEELRALGLASGTLGGFEHLSTENVEVADGEEVFVVLGLPSGTEVNVHGRVLLAGEGVRAIAQWVRLGTGGSEGMVMGQAGADGAYALELDQPGAWQVAVTALDEPRGRAELSVRVPPVREHEQDLELPGGSISGRVLASTGAPLEGVKVTLRALAGARHRSTLTMPGDIAITGAEGRYAFHVLEPGTYAVAAQGWEPESGVPAFAAAAREDVVLVAGEHVEDVDFLLEPGGKISGFVLDTDERPVAGAAVFVFDASGRALNPIAATHAADQGWFATRPLASGDHVLVARFRERVSAPLPVDVGNQALGDVELVLRPGADLVVEWSAEDVHPREVVPFVQVSDRDGRRWGGLRDQRQPFDWRKDPTDPQLPRVGPLPPGTYLVVASLPDGRQGAAEITLTAPGEQRVRLVLE